VAVQSTRLTGVQLERRIEAFLDKFAGILAATEEEEIESTREACLMQEVDEQKSLASEAGTLFGEVVTLDLEFDRVAKAVRAMQSIDKAKLVEVYDAMIRPGAARRRAISVVVENGKAQENTAEGTATHQAPPCGPVLSPQAALPFLVAGAAIPEAVLAAPIRAAEVPAELPAQEVVPSSTGAPSEGEAEGEVEAAEAPTLCSEVGLRSASVPVIEVVADREVLRSSLPMMPRTGALHLAAFREAESASQSS